jgi:CBS domain-containing protein
LGFSKVFDYVAGNVDWMGFGLPVEKREDIRLVGEHLVTDWPVCGLADTTQDAKQRAQGVGVSFCPVVNEAVLILGVVGEEEWQGPESMPVEEIMDTAPTTFRPSVSVLEAIEFLDKYRQDAVLVTSSNGRLMGVFRSETMPAQLPKSQIWA